MTQLLIQAWWPTARTLGPVLPSTLTDYSSLTAGTLGPVFAFVISIREKGSVCLFHWSCRNSLFGLASPWSGTCPVALPSAAIQDLFDGKGFNTVGAAVLLQVRYSVVPGTVSEKVVALPSTSIRALPNGIGLDTNWFSGLLEIHYSVLGRNAWTPCII